LGRLGLGSRNSDRDMRATPTGGSIAEGDVGSSKTSRRPAVWEQPKGQLRVECRYWQWAGDAPLFRMQTPRWLRNPDRWPTMAKVVVGFVGTILIHGIVRMVQWLIP